MNNYVRPPPIFTLGAILRASVLVTLVWIIGDAWDGGSQSIVPPLLVTAWLYVIVVLDRWVFQRTGEGSPSTSRGPMELIERRLGANMPSGAAGHAQCSPLLRAGERLPPDVGDRQPLHLYQPPTSFPALPSPVRPAPSGAKSRP
jgi:hypothetical protein